MNTKESKLGQKYDLTKLNYYSDSTLSKEWGITRERVRQIRLKFKINKFSLDLNKEEKLVNCLKENGFINLTFLKKETSIRYYNGKSLNLEVLQTIVDKHHLNLKLKQDQEHGYSGYVRGCKCDICRLSNNLRSLRFKKKLGKNLNIKQCDFYANEFYELYKLDDSYHKELFCEFIKEDLKVRFSTKLTDSESFPKRETNVDASIQSYCSPQI